jgi:hypothetical protein
VIREGEIKLELLVDKDYRCDYGTDRRHPRDPTRVPMNPDGRCSPSLASLQRGAAHAPGPVSP